MIHIYSNNKYSNHKIIIDGEKYDSKKEARRHMELILLQRAGEIKNLQRQVKFVLIPPQKYEGKAVERECAYIADFTYHDAKNGEYIVEDTKGMKTKDYIIKRKLMLWVHGIRILET